MRLPRGVGDDPLLHTALLAYASDYLLLDMVFRSHPQPYTPTGFTGFSLDHAVWLHRPVRFDRWHLHTQQTLALSGASRPRTGHDPRRGRPPRRQRGARGAGPAAELSAPYGGPMTPLPHRLFEQSWPEGEYRLFQLGFVVDDLLGTAMRWATVFAVGPFHVLPRIESPCTYRGTASAVDVQIAVAQAGPVQIDELIHQHCDRASVYRELVDEGSSSFHQLCSVTRDYDGKKAHYERLGYGLACEFTEGPRVVYFDTVDEFGFFTEVVEETPGFLAGVDSIARTCAAWDGSDPVRLLTREPGLPHPVGARPRPVAGWSATGLSVRSAARIRRPRCTRPSTRGRAFRRDHPHRSGPRHAHPGRQRPHAAHLRDGSRRAGQP